MIQRNFNPFVTKRGSGVPFADTNYDPLEAVEMTSYKALEKIQEIPEDGSLNDRESFLKRKEMIRVFESLGTGCTFRHDFV